MVRARINPTFFLLLTYCIHDGCLKVLCYLHYKVCSLAHFLVRSMRLSILCVSRAFRHTFTVSSPRPVFHFIHIASLCYAFPRTLSHVLSHAFAQGFLSRSMCVHSHKVLCVFPVFPSAFIHPFLARSPWDSLPLSHAVTFCSSVSSRPLHRAFRALRIFFVTNFPRVPFLIRFRP